MSLFSDTFRLTVVDFFGEFYNLTVDACINRPYLAAIRGPMTIKALPDLRIGTGEVAKNFKIFGVRWENSFGDDGFGFLFSSRTSRSKSQNVNIILLGAFPDATDAFSDASIFYYSFKRHVCHQHFWKIA